MFGDLGMYFGFLIFSPGLKQCICTSLDLQMHLLSCFARSDSGIKC